MAKPQQPEIARSGGGAPAPASVKTQRDAPSTVRVDGDTGSVPEDNLPGHHPEQDQDKPSGDDFVRKLHDHARAVDAARTETTAEAPPEPEATVAGEALRAAAGVLRKVRESLPG